MSTPARAAARHLQQSGLGWLLDLARRKVEEQDGVRGTVVADLSDAERVSLAGLIGWRRLPPAGAPGPVRLRLTDLDASLRASQYGVGLMDVLDAAGGPVETRRQRAGAAAARWEAQLYRLGAQVPPAAQDWAAGLVGDGPSARRYRRAYQQDPMAAAAAALAVGRALAELPPAAAELLAVFAARCTGDPHAFDAGCTTGALFLAALCERFGLPPVSLPPVEQRSWLLSQANLDAGSLSSTVLVAYLAAPAHPVLTAMATHGGGWPLPLAAVRQLAADRPGCGRAYVVENPQVFEFLVQGLAHHLEPPALISTGGFLSAAALGLLDWLHAFGCQLCYGGDFDRNGLAIANSLLGRYPGLVLWRMAPGDYETALEPGVPPLPAGDRDWLETLAGPLADTSRRMLAAERPAYQERLVDALLGDLCTAAPAHSGVGEHIAKADR